MNIRKTVEVFGDSILKGVQLDPLNMRYRVDNNIDVGLIEKKHSLSIRNFSKFGCTITKGLSMIENRLKNNEPSCDAILMNLGGNDCDFNWKAISERPEDEHMPNTPLDIFVDTYRKVIDLLKEKRIRPVLATLPPLDAQKFFQWFCGSLNKENVLKWLGSVDTIYNWQENYSKTVEKIAHETGTLIVDLRGAFLKHKKPEPFLCEDGTHPNTEGQKLITQAFMELVL